MAVTEGTQPAPVTWTGAWGSTTPQATASFTPEAGALLVALVCGSGPGSTITATVSDSVGGTTGWVLLVRQNAVGSNTQGTAEVWCKDSPGTAMTVSTYSSSATGTGGQLTVRTLTGAAASGSQNGAVNSLSNDAAAAVQISVAAGTGNRIYGSAFNWDTSAAMTVLGNTTAIAAFADATNGDNWASCKSAADTAGTATYGYSTSVRGKIALAEIKAGGGGGPGGAGGLLATAAGTAEDATGRAGTGLLYAGAASGTGWVDTSSATGATQGTYATWTSIGAGASATLELSAFDVQAAVPAGATVGDLTVVVRHSEDPANQIASVRAQCYLAGTPYGVAQDLTVSATVHDDTITVAGLAYADLADLRVQVTATRT